jgi:hypothetical protein
VVVFYRAPVEKQDLASLHNNQKNRHGTLAFGGASLNSVAFGSISLRSTRKGALLINPFMQLTRTFLIFNSFVSALKKPRNKLQKIENQN